MSSSSPSWWRAAVGRARVMGPLEWAEAVLPCWAWMRKYRWKEDLQADLAAGVTVGVMLVPQVPAPPYDRFFCCLVSIKPLLGGMSFQ
jgi:sulfate transporter 4